MKLRRAFGLILWLVMLAPRPAAACKCELLLNVCSETGYSSMVFVGTVESLTPNIMTRWKPAEPADLDRINRAQEQYLANRSADTFGAFKDAIRSAFPGLAEEDRRRLENAPNQTALIRLVTSVLEGVRRIRFRVRTVFRKDDDDDKKPDDDDAPETQSLELVTPFGDCGFDFQVGETYLVYATDDEETNVLETNTCTRTRRLSDAGADLAYLYFYKDRKNPSGRLQGFTTFDRLYQVQARDPDRIPSPADAITIELKSDRWVRYTTSNALGQFIFDGLDAGNYQLTAYPAAFPASTKILAGPRRFHIDAKGCATQVLIIPKESP